MNPHSDLFVMHTALAFNVVFTGNNTRPYDVTRRKSNAALAVACTFHFDIKPIDLGEEMNEVTSVKDG